MKKLLLLILFALNLLLLQAQEVKFISVNTSVDTFFTNRSLGEGWENINFKRLPKLLEKDSITADTLTEPTKWMARLSGKLSCKQRKDSNIYIFFVPNQKDSASIYLPLSGKYGYVIFDTAKTSVYWPDSLVKRLRTLKYQWDYVHNPVRMVRLAQEDEEGESFDIRMITFESNVHLVDAQTIESFTFVTPAGGLISLPKEKIQRVSFTTDWPYRVPYGALIAFSTIDNKSFTAIYNFSVDPPLFHGYASIDYSKDKNDKGRYGFMQPDLVELSEQDKITLGFRKDCNATLFQVDYDDWKRLHGIKYANDFSFDHIAEIKPKDHYVPDEAYNEYLWKNDVIEVYDPTLCVQNYLGPPDEHFKSPGDLGYWKENYVVHAKYNPYGQGGVLMYVHGYDPGIKQERYHYIYAVEDEISFNTHYYQYDIVNNVWKSAPDPTIDCASCVLNSFLFSIIETVFEIVTDPHTALDVLGLIPVAGELFDGINAVWYLIEGDEENALLSVASLVPVVGDAMGKTGKITIKVLRSGKSLYRYTDEVVTFSKSFLTLTDDAAITFSSAVKRIDNANLSDMENCASQVAEFLSKNQDKAKFIDNLTKVKTDPKEIEKILSKIDNLKDSYKAKLLGDLLDVSDNPNHISNNLDKLSGELVESWKSFKNAGLDDLARNTENLDALNKALKQSYYDAAYFENLLKTKSDPQKFIDDYVKKLGDDGKFLDADMESKYTDYLARKAREGKTPRDRADWNHARDYWLNDSPMARGNAFNDVAKQKYDINELNLVLDDGSFVRVDSYVPAALSETGEGMIISRKATDLVDIKESTFRMHLQEMVNKYSPGTKIHSNVYTDIGETIEGKMYLEIPKTNETFSKIAEYKSIAKNEYDIEIIFLAE